MDETTAVAEPEVKEEQDPQLIDVFGVMVPAIPTLDKWKILRTIATDGGDGGLGLVRAEQIAFGDHVEEVEAAIAAKVSGFDEFASMVETAMQIVISDGKNEEAKNA